MRKPKNNPWEEIVEEITKVIDKVTRKEKLRRIVEDFRRCQLDTFKTRVKVEGNHIMVKNANDNTKNNGSDS